MKPSAGSGQRVQAISRGNGERFHLPDGPKQQARDTAMATVTRAVQVIKRVTTEAGRVSVFHRILTRCMAPNPVPDRATNLRHDGRG
jgi:hypothetical protein